ncbi:MAG: VWA domain-containing protein [Proteobacteria bacterium]|nr:VWA domain-containing protein [Pseudomonadota bacterium]NBP12872.1 VWA domain-containing protein [bacterium]
MSAPLNTVSPLTYPTWLKYQGNLKPDTATELYTQYLHEWYRNNTLLTSNNSNAIKENYIQLLKDLSFLFGTQEKDLFLAELDYANDEELILAIPYFVKKLKEIAKVLSNKREAVKNAKLRYNLIGSNNGLEKLLYEYVLKGFTRDENYITQVPISSLSNFFPTLSSVNGNFFVELEELHDSQSYHDSDPSVSINEYVDVTQLENEIPFEDMTEDEILGIISTRYLPRIADTPLSRLFNQYLLEVPTLSTLAISNQVNGLIYNEIAANQKYLGQTVYGLTAVRTSEINVPDYVLNLNFAQGNNWFYWPSGDKIVDDSKFNNIFSPIAINDTSFVACSATGGSDYSNSDLFFSDKTGTVEGAWLKGPRSEYAQDTMNLLIKPNTTRDFIFPYPGFTLTSKGTLWNGYSLNDDDYSLYEKLLPEQRTSILTKYYTETLPSSATLPVYINDTSLVYNGAYADKFSDAADTITQRPDYKGINSVYSDSLSGVLEQTYLYKFDKTDFPVSIGVNDVIWPLDVFDSTQNIPITVLSDTCIPVKLSEIDVPKTMAGAVAGANFGDADIIYKLNTRTDDPVEAAWLGAGSIHSLDLTSKIDVYDSPVINCAAYVDGIIQGALSTKIDPRQKVSFVWMDEDTPADEVFFYRQHAADCPYLKESPHDYYSNQDYQNPNPLNNQQAWTKCRCKSIHYSPIGHAGSKVTDYNKMADYLFADPQGLGADFAFNTWTDTRGLNYTNSPQFSFYQIDEQYGDHNVGWGTGKWKTPTGAPMILKTGRVYTYYRTSFRSDSLISSDNITPYLIVNYPYKNIKGLYSNTSSNQYDISIIIDKSRSENRNIEQTLDLVKSFANSLINSNIDTQISVISFNKNATIASYLTHDINVINYNIDNINIESTYPEYQTDIYSALKVSETVLTTTIIDNNQATSFYELCNSLNATIEKAGTFSATRNIPRSNANKVIILFSDGYETLNVGNAAPYAQTLKNTGKYIYAVDIGPNSSYSDTMEQIASDKGYFNLQKYLTQGDGNINNFLQYLLSLFSQTRLSVVPTWYKAVRDTFGNWITTTDISDMELLPGDYLTYVHRGQATYSGNDNISFSTPSISFTVNIKLNGWDYNTNTFSLTSVGSNFGAKPFWGKSYLAPEENYDQHYDKQVMSFGGQVRFINGYLPVHQPEISPMILTTGNLLSYTRNGGNNLIWNQSLTFNVTLSSYQWNKIIFYKDYSNLQDIFRSGNNLDLIGYGSDEPSDIVLESYSAFLPSKYNYYARNPFNYKQNLYYKSKCLTSFVQFSTGIAVEAVQPYANLDNVHFPTVATVSFPSLAKSDKQIGEYMLPENLGVSYWRGRGYTINVSGDTLTFIDGISAERLFLDTNKFGPRQRGLTKNDQYSPVVIEDIDNRWVMESYSSSNAAGRITDTLNNQKFTPYQSKYEITKRNDLGLSRQNDDFDFWDFPIPGTWNKPEKYPLTFRKELLASSYANRKSELLVNKGEMTEWKNDIFGNNYGLFKSQSTLNKFLSGVPPKIYSAFIGNKKYTYKTITYVSSWSGVDMNGQDLTQGANSTITFDSLGNKTCSGTGIGTYTDVNTYGCSGTCNSHFENCVVVNDCGCGTGYTPWGGLLNGPAGELVLVSQTENQQVYSESPFIMGVGGIPSTGSGTYTITLHD